MNIFKIKFFDKWSNFLRELEYLQYKMDEYDFDTQLEKYSKYRNYCPSVCLFHCTCFSFDKIFLHLKKAVFHKFCFFSIKIFEP